MPRDEEVWRTTPSEALAAAFAQTELELRGSYECGDLDKSGTCGLTVLTRGHRLFIGCLGDCRALLVRGDDNPRPWVQLTTDQRATESFEHKRIKEAGGTVTDGRISGALIPSRTLGDFPWKDRGPGLSCEPEITEYEVTADDKYLVLGSDGLFDVLSNKTIARLICRMASSAQKACNELVKELKKRPGMDDVTIVVLQFCHSQ